MNDSLEFRLKRGKGSQRKTDATEAEENKGEKGKLIRSPSAHIPLVRSSKK